MVSLDLDDVAILVRHAHGQAKVRYAKMVEFGDEHIFGFQVAMCPSSLVDKREP